MAYEWQPIETMTDTERSGPVLLMCHEWLDVASFSGPKGAKIKGLCKVHLAGWSEETSCWHHWWIGGKVMMCPTHWAPMPAMPCSEPKPVELSLVDFTAKDAADWTLAIQKHNDPDADDKRIAALEDKSQIMLTERGPELVPKKCHGCKKSVGEQGQLTTENMFWWCKDCLMGGNFENYLHGNGLRYPEDFVGKDIEMREIKAGDMGPNTMEGKPVGPDPNVSWHKTGGLLYPEGFHESVKALDAIHARCECGAEVAKTTHANWCPKHQT